MTVPDSRGLTFVIPPPASETCPSGRTCTTSVVINGVTYKPGDIVTLPLGVNTLNYVVTDDLGNVASSPTTVTVVDNVPPTLVPPPNETRPVATNNVLIKPPLQIDPDATLKVTLPDGTVVNPGDVITLPAGTCARKASPLCHAHALSPSLLVFYIFENALALWAGVSYGYPMCNCFISLRI